MYLILKTYANCDLNDAAVTACAVLEASPVLVARLTGWMDKAAAVSAELAHKDVALSWTDYSPEYFRALPELDDFADGDLDAGWCLLATPPFPDSEEGYVTPGAPTSLVPFVTPEPWYEPVRLAYSELRVSATEVSWYYAPKYGSVEEYTVALTREDLAEIAAQLHGDIAAAENPYDHASSASGCAPDCKACAWERSYPGAADDEAYEQERQRLLREEHPQQQTQE